MQLSQSCMTCGNYYFENKANTNLVGGNPGRKRWHHRPHDNRVTDDRFLTGRLKRLWSRNLKYASSISIICVVLGTKTRHARAFLLNLLFLMKRWWWYLEILKPSNLLDYFHLHVNWVVILIVIQTEKVRVWSIRHSCCNRWIAGSLKTLSLHRWVLKHLYPKLCNPLLTE